MYFSIKFVYIFNFIKKEKFCTIRDQLILSNKYSSLFSPCYSCNEDTHILYKCPLITHNSKKSQAIQRLNYSKPQLRQVFVRKGDRNKYALKNFQRNRLGSFKIRFNGTVMRTFERSICPHELPLSFKDNLDQVMFDYQNKKKAALKNTIDSLSLQSFRDLADHLSCEQDFVIKRWKSAENLKQFTGNKNCIVIDSNPSKIVKILTNNLINLKRPENALNKNSKENLLPEKNKKIKDGRGIFQVLMNQKKWKKRKWEKTAISRTS